MQAAEDAARFLHHACRGLPVRLNGRTTNGLGEYKTPPLPTDLFYARVVEHAVAYFGSRVLYPSRPSPEPSEYSLSRAAYEKAAQAATRADQEKLDSIAQEWGYRLGNEIYGAYLAGKVKPRGLRRLFLAHLNQPGEARKVCTAVIARLRSASR